MSRRTIFSLVALLTASGQPLQAWVQVSPHVRSQLLASRNFLSHSGYEIAHDVFSGALFGGEHDDLWINLNGDMEYAIVGACDRGCNNLDLEIYDVYDMSIDLDDASDPSPVVNVTPAAARTYRVRVRMVDCFGEECVYSVGVFARDRRWDNANRWEQQILRQLGRAGRSFRAAGYERLPDVESGTLFHGDVSEFDVELQAGMRYMVLGVCDVNCTNVDLIVYDDAGVVVETDERPNDHPLIKFEPRRSGRYRVQLRMSACRPRGRGPASIGPDDGCYYGIGVFTKRTGWVS